MARNLKKGRFSYINRVDGLFWNGRHPSIAPSLKPGAGFGSSMPVDRRRRRDPPVSADFPEAAVIRIAKELMNTSSGATV